MCFGFSPADSLRKIVAAQKGKRKTKTREGKNGQLYISTTGSPCPCVVSTYLCWLPDSTKPPKPRRHHHHHHHRRHRRSARIRTYLARSAGLPRRPPTIKKAPPPRRASIHLPPYSIRQRQQQARRTRRWLTVTTHRPRRASSPSFPPCRVPGGRQLTYRRQRLAQRRAQLLPWIESPLTHFFHTNAAEHHPHRATGEEAGASSSKAEHDATAAEKNDDVLYEEIESEEATSGELFYDLFFVANLTTITSVHYMTDYNSGSSLPSFEWPRSPWLMLRPYSVGVVYPVLHHPLVLVAANHPV